MYRWVDKDGKVHYSETAPLDTPAAENKIDVKTPSATADDATAPKAKRDRAGNCVTIKCTADQMEADRLAREREYARRIAENERAGDKKPATDRQAAKDRALDEHLRESCLNGVYYGGDFRVDCNDIDTLRAQWKNYHAGHGRKVR